MGNFLEKPITEKRNVTGEGNNLRYGIGSMQGWRTEMEDAHIARIGLGEGYESWSFFGVFDGHGGATVATLCAEHLLDFIMKSPEFSEGKIREAMITGFMSMDTFLYKRPEFASGEDKSGSTAICALINPTNIYVANLGDSRAIWCKLGDTCFSTIDHKPMNPPERERILSAGGNVVLQRVNGSLAVSRAVGDFQYKLNTTRAPTKQLVSIEPDIYTVNRNDESDEFLLLACDGIWDVMLNEDVADYLRYMLSVTDNLEIITNSIIDTCLFKKSLDNMSVIVLLFPKAPKPSLQAIKQDEALNRKLANMVRNIVGTQKNIDFRTVVSALEEEDIPDLPPGGGLSSKMILIQQVYFELCPLEAEKARPTLPDRTDPH